MPEPRYRIESEKYYPLVDWLECDNLSIQGAKWALAYMEKKLHDNAFNLGLRIVPVEVTE